MNADEVIEWANERLEDWDECFSKNIHPTEILHAPMGQILRLKSGYSNMHWRFRRMPRDPLLRAMVEAGLEAGK